MSDPIINLQKIVNAISSFEKYGSAAGIDGATAATLIAARFIASYPGPLAAGRVLLELYNIFGVDAVNIAVAAAIAGTLPVDPAMLKVINVAK